MSGRRIALAALAETIEKTPGRIAIRAIDADGVMAALTYRELYEGACAAAAGLARLGLAAGDRIVLSMPTCGEFFSLYLACLCAGLVPAVVPGARAQAAADALAARFIVLRGAAPAEGDSRHIEAGDLLTAAPGRAIALAAEGEAMAHLQGTSGTTAMPRWAIVRHRNIAANVQAIGRAIDHRDDDALVTWLPMSHDMGLIGVSYAWYWGIPVVAADPANFIRNPLFWLELIGKFEGTLSPAPNSAFQACCRVAKLRPPKDLDLSSWRVALCGSEPVHEATLREFYETFRRHGLRREVLMPVYGLAEATLAVTISSTSESFRVERVDPAAGNRDAVVPASGEAGKYAVAVVGCGRVIPGHALRIVDGGGQPVADGVVGEIEFAGESVVDGYFGVDDTAELKRDGFLRTGDLGYLRGGELFITGRVKEILIINGRNFSPLQIEGTLERLLGASFTPAVIAVEGADEQLRSGALHLLLDSRLGPGDRTRVEARVKQVLDEAFGLRGARLHWVLSGHIPRTPSGKIQRGRCRDLIAR
ncbi:MAG TPA: AMP-binding protein, partial [Stellaceae bacterium]|nr:AMP-binding protein [Stellaceae bacterium]